jgi:DUF4097 and DUF4098 domain-containing protein YvlB
MSILLALSSAVACYGTTDQVDVPLTNPSKPALVKVKVIHGSITVIGYNGKNVTVEAALGEDESHDDDEIDVDIDDEKDKKKTKGMFRIRNGSTGLTVIEENNEVTITTPSHFRFVKLTIKVPVKSSLDLRAVNGGFIKVDNVDGDLDVKHTNGPLALKNVSGTVVANTTNGDVTVTFNRINLDKPMAFTTFNGDVDVTFPANAKFNFKMKSERGDIYSDFKLDMKASGPSKKVEKKEGKFKVTFEKSVLATLNGGGEEVTFKTYNGDIYIRKK